MRHLLSTATALALASLLLSACADSRPPAGTGVVPVTPNPGVDPTAKRTRYSFANRCVVLKSKDSGNYVAATSGGYSASAREASQAEPFYMKPAALGDYLLYARDGSLLNGAATVNTVSLAQATDTAIFRLLADADVTVYPAAPQYNVPPDAATLTAYRNFVDPNILADQFTFATEAGTRLTAAGTGAMTVAAASDAASQRFQLQEVSG